jgi:lipopolysaccharide biosynthesis glycosyltransferase
MLHLTGFSSDAHCKLCIGAKAIAKSNVSTIYCKHCKHCIYSLVSEKKSFHCLNETYNKLAHSDTPETTYEALQERIKFLEETINTYEKL